MALIHVTAMRNILADAINTQVNTGAGIAVLRIEVAAGPTTLIDFPLQNPAYGTPTNGTIILQGTPIGASASGTGVADQFKVIDRNGAEVFRGTVTGTGGGGDIEVDDPNIVSGQPASLDAHSYSASA